MEPPWDEAAKEPPAETAEEAEPAPRDCLKELPPPDDGEAGLTAPRLKPDENMVDTRRSIPPLPSEEYAAELFFGRRLKRMIIITTASKLLGNVRAYQSTKAVGGRRKRERSERSVVLLASCGVNTQGLDL